MPQQLDIDGLESQAEDAVTATWLDELGPYIALHCDGRGDESDASEIVD